MNNSMNENSISKNKKRSRFNFIDFIFVLIIILAIATLVYIFSPISFIKDLANKQPQQIQYTVEIGMVDESFINKISENDTVVDSVSKNTIGTVTAVDYNTKYSELNMIEQKLEDGSVKKVGELVEYPNKYNVIVTITADAEYSAGNGYTVNAKRIAVGEKMSIRFPDYICEGYCIGVTPQ